MSYHLSAPGGQTIDWSVAVAGESKNTPRGRRVSKAARRVKALPTPSPIERRMTKFLREPPKMRTAAGVIVAATLVVVVGGGALFRLLDHEEYQTIWTGMWFALQTVTTVGYGDVTPKNPSGKIVAALIMLEGVAFLAIVTAAITSTFVTRAARERLATVEGAETDDVSRIEARFDDLAAQLNRLESTIGRLAGPEPDRSSE
jgi:voltage-gated potassium channel